MAKTRTRRHHRRAPSTVPATSRSPASEGPSFAEAATTPPPGLLRDYWDFLRHNKKLWMAPIIVLLLLFGLLIILGGSAAAPFIYPLF